MQFKMYFTVVLLTGLLLSIAGLSFADPPKGYYDTAVGRTGHELRTALHAIIDNHTVYPYTSSSNDNWLDREDVDVWEALTYTDSACVVEEPDCGQVQLLYLGEARHISKANRGQGGNDNWDREHVWPKSRGFSKKSQDGYTDLHHLRPADRNINGAHSNYGYDSGGDVIFDKRHDGSLVPTEAKLDKINLSFEPPDRAKGQVARMLFYMAVRYEFGDDGEDEKMPDLYLQDENDRVKKPWIGDLCTLVHWNNMFSPTDFERRRNDRVMELQGNRNPFIDNPGWPNLIWQAQCQQ